MTDKVIEPEYAELAALMGCPDSRYLPRIFNIALTPEQARVALSFNISAEDIADTLGITIEEVEDAVQERQVEAIAARMELDKENVAEHIRYMFEMGYAFPTRRGWRWAREALQMHDSQTNTRYDERLGPEYFVLWKAFNREERYPTLKQTVAEGSQMYRVIPASSTLEDNLDILPSENVEEILKKAAVLAVVHCPCKRLEPERDPDIPVEVCIISDRVAEHNIRRGTARIISLEDALDIHEAATRAGLVCMPQGMEDFPKAVCHCHHSSCGIITPAQLTGYPVQAQVAPSVYTAVTDYEKCTGCGDCLAACQFGAIEMRPSGSGDTPVSVVDTDKCMGCGLCVLVCPSGARKMSLR